MYIFIACFINTKNMSKRAIAWLTIILSLVIDQASKIWVKLTMQSGEEFRYIGDWARIHFVENEGMAFGMSFGGGYGKLMLTVFRIIAVSFLSYVLAQQIKLQKSSKLYIFCLAMILAGALGNIIDSAFYGLIFTESPYHGGLAQLVSMGQGYGTFLHGKVVDMLYLDRKSVV